MDVWNKAHPTNIRIEIPQTVEQPSETLLLRREASEIRGRLGSEGELMEARRKLKDIWAPRIQELQPGLRRAEA